METTYTLKASEINQDFFNVFLEMKKLFKNRMIQITVTETETPQLLKDIKQAVKEVNSAKNGVLKARNADKLLEELSLQKS